MWMGVISPQIYGFGFELQISKMARSLEQAMDNS